MFSDMPSFESKWFFLGYADRYDYKELSELLAKYKCTMKDNPNPSNSVYVDNPFRIDSIRKRLWGHRWATDKDWLANNPHEKDFDPRKVIKKN